MRSNGAIGRIARDDAPDAFDELVERQPFLDERGRSGLDAGAPRGPVRVAGHDHDVDAGVAQPCDQRDREAKRTEMEVEQHQLRGDRQHVGDDAVVRRHGHDVRVDAVCAQCVGRRLREQFVVVDEHDPRRDRLGGGRCRHLGDGHWAFLSSGVGKGV